MSVEFAPWIQHLPGLWSAGHLKHAPKLGNHRWVYLKMWYTYGRGPESQLLHVGYGLFSLCLQITVLKRRKWSLTRRLWGFSPEFSDEPREFTNDQNSFPEQFLADQLWWFFNEWINFKRKPDEWFHSSTHGILSFGTRHLMHWCKNPGFDGLIPVFPTLGGYAPLSIW